jgi:hypothetical protein
LAACRGVEHDRLLLMTATVTFTSHQDPAASPNHASCTSWRIVLYLRITAAADLLR